MSNALKRFMTSRAFMEFHRRMRELYEELELNHSMVGFNYRDGCITSTKFYYVFRRPFGVNGPFPIPMLEDQYRRVIERRSAEHFQDRLLPGGWLTFTIKFDAQGNCSRGFFLRVEAPNQQLIDNTCLRHRELGFEAADFDRGYGQYLMEGDDGPRASEYLYLLRPERLAHLADMYDVDFSRAGCVEISACGSPHHMDQKFIAVTLLPVAGRRFVEGVPAAVRIPFQGMDSQLCCPAVSPTTGQRSIYVTGRWEGGRFSCSLVDELVARCLVS